MQKILIAIAALVCFASCNNPSTTESTTAKSDDKAQKNLAAAQTIAKAFETGNTASLDSVVSDDFLDHTDRGDKKGRDSLKAMVTWLHSNMKDMKMEIMREVADDEYVFQWMRYTGSSNGAMGMPAGPYDMHVMEISKYADGKAVEHWAYMDMGEMMKMMGQMPPMPADHTDHMMKDSAMKK